MGRNEWIDSDDHCIYYCGWESLRRNGVALIVSGRVWNAILGCRLKNDRMILVHFQGRPFSMIVIQAYAPKNNAEEKVEWFSEDLHDFLERTHTHTKSTYLPRFQLFFSLIQYSLAKLKKRQLHCVFILLGESGPVNISSWESCSLNYD